MALVREALDSGTTKRAVCTSLPKGHSVIIASIQNISPHLVELHLKITTQTQRRKK